METGICRGHASQKGSPVPPDPWGAVLLTQRPPKGPAEEAEQMADAAPVA